MGCVSCGISNHEEFNRQLFELVLKAYSKATMFKGALNVLQYLKKNHYKLALITNTPSVLVQSYFNNNNLPNFFDVIITREDVSKLKPNPESYKKALLLLGVTKKQYKNVLVIGDSEQDIAAGNKLGIDCVLFEPRKTERNDLVNYEYKIKSFEELKKGYPSEKKLAS